MTVAELMREWRRIAGINTLTAGAELGLSSRSVEDIEQGRTRVDDVLTRRGLEALIAEAKLHARTDAAQAAAALAAVAEREGKVGRKRK